MTTPDDLSALIEIRSAAGVRPATPMQKLLLPSLADLHLGNVPVPSRFEPHRTAGFVTRMQDVTASDAVEVTRSYGMDKVAGWPTGGPAFVLRFYACWLGLYQTSFGSQTAESAARFGFKAVYPAPFLGTGYTNYAPAPIPEYFMHLTELVAGTELWRIEADGSQQMIGKYVNRQLGWYRMAEPSFGPSRFFVPPVPLRPRVRRGLLATYQGVEYEADFGPQPGQLTLHTRPGRQAPDGFEERGGTYSLTVDDVACDGMRYVRQHATYKDAPFELVDASDTHAMLYYLGENYETAQELGLVEVDYRVWRTRARLDALTPTEESVTIEPQGIYGSR